jgi:m7GpppX diphosphatase
LNKNKIRAFVHYQPTFYHFHIHYLDVDIDSNSTSVSRAHDLHSIIQNLQIDNDYYKKVELNYVLVENSQLHKALFE